jgi:hypothetical protein
MMSCHVVAGRGIAMNSHKREDSRLACVLMAASLLTTVRGFLGSPDCT